MACSSLRACCGAVLGTTMLALSASGAAVMAQSPQPQPQTVAAPIIRLPDSSKMARPGTTLALNAAQRALVEKVSAYLSGIQTMTGDFVQIGPDGKRTEGQFFIQKPGKVRFEYAAPSPVEIIADGSTVAVRDRNLATQDLYPLSQTPLRFLLAPKLDLLRDTNLVGVYADDVFTTVVIEEKQALVGTSRLMLMFSAKDNTLRQWTVTDPQGYDTTVAVYNLDTHKKPDPALFKIDYTRYDQ